MTGAVTWRQRAILLAQAELSAPTWGVATQFLAVHEVILGENGEPTVAHVDVDREAGAYFVYFPIRDQPYYFVVVIRADEAGVLAISGMYVEAGVRVYLSISGVTLSAAEITTRLGLDPTETRATGDSITRVTPTRVHRRHGWRLEPQQGIPGSVEQKLAAVLHRIEPAVARVAALGPACNVQINIVFQGWRGDPQFGGIHLDVDSVQRLAALGAELDFDLYAFGPKMLEGEQTRE